MDDSRTHALVRTRAIVQQNGYVEQHQLHVGCIGYSYRGRRSTEEEGYAMHAGPLG